MPRILTNLALLLLLAYLLLCLALFLYQRSLIYFPQARSNQNPETTHSIKTADAKLMLTAKKLNTDYAVLYFGGNAEDVSTRLADLTALFPQHAIYLPHYRGFGGSDGKPTEAALHADALALYQEISQRHRHIILIGRSLGTGVAIRLASVQKVARLILITPYDSLQELAVQQYPFVPVRWLLQDKFESWRYAAQINVPTSVILAQYDEVIPAASSQQLLARFTPGIANSKIITGSNHNSILDSQEFLDALRSANSGLEPPKNPAQNTIHSMASMGT